MKTNDYQATLTTDLSAKETFERIVNVSEWWNSGLKGASKKLNDQFTVQFGDVHVSTQKIVELVPEKMVVWLVTQSKLNFIKQQDEWNNTRIVFEVSTMENKTQVRFTHHGLNPDVECFTGCSQGWDYYIKGSLNKYLTTGNGTPG